MIAEIDGNQITTEMDFHKQISKALDFSSYYGENLDALWDVLSSDIERPLKLNWKNSEISRKAMPLEYKRIIDLLRKVVDQDIKFGWEDRFEIELS
jgi:ribonuclease inhibitor